MESKERKGRVWQMGLHSWYAMGIALCCRKVGAIS